MERALLVLAYFIELDGDVHLPMYEKFEAEVKELKARQDVKSRAHCICPDREMVSIRRCYGNLPLWGRELERAKRSIGAGDAPRSLVLPIENQCVIDKHLHVLDGTLDVLLPKIFHIFFVRRSKIPAFSKQVWGD